MIHSRICLLAWIFLASIGAAPGDAQIVVDRPTSATLSPGDALRIRGLVNDLGDIDKLISYELYTAPGLATTLESANLGDWSYELPSNPGIEDLVELGDRYPDYVARILEKKLNESVSLYPASYRLHQQAVVDMTTGSAAYSNGKLMSMIHHLHIIYGSFYILSRIHELPPVTTLQNWLSVKPARRTPLFDVWLINRYMKAGTVSNPRTAARLQTLLNATRLNQNDTTINQPYKPFINWIPTPSPTPSSMSFLIKLRRDLHLPITIPQPTQLEGGGDYEALVREFMSINQ